MLSWSDSMLGQASYAFLSVFVPIAVQSCLLCILPRGLGEEECATHADTHRTHNAHKEHKAHSLSHTHPLAHSLTFSLAHTEH